MRVATWAALFAVAVAACAGGEVRPSVPGPAKVADGKPRSDLIPRAVLFGNPERTSVEISPDGKYLSWLAPSDGVQNVWVAPAGELDQARPVTADRTRPVSDYVWTFDGKHLLYRQDKAGDENWHLYRVEVATRRVTDLTPGEGARAELFALSPKKPGTVVIGLNDRDPQLFDVYAVDLASGEKRLLVRNEQGFVGYHVDRDLDVRYAETMKPDGSRVLMAHDPSNPRAAWTEYDTISPDDALTTGIIGFDATGRSYYTYDSRGRDTSAIFEVDARSKHKTLLLEDARVDLNDGLVHPSRGTVQAALINYDRPIWRAIDATIAPDLDAIARLGPGFPDVVSRTLDDRTWIVSLGTDAGAARFYRWDRATQKGEFLFSEQPALDDQPLVPMHPIVISARDQLAMVSYLSLPRDADANADGKADRPLPLVLLVHGGPWGRDEWGFDPLHQLLANRGYAALSVNFRASSGYGKAFLNAGNRQWGKKMHDDLLDAVAWAIASHATTRDRICIMGGSYGGYATLVGVAMTPDVFACGLDMVGPSNLVTLLETVPPYWLPMASMFRARVGDHTTPPGKQALLDVSPLTHAARIEKPLLIAQGANDPRVKRAESDRIVAVMRAHRIPVSYLVFPDEGHGLARPENNVAFVAIAEAFLSAHLGGWFQPITDAELRASSMKIEAGREWLPGLPGAGQGVSAR